MAVVEMDRICICALKKDRKPLLEFLQRQGSVEVSPASPDELFSSMDTAVSCTLFEKNAETAARAQEVLNRYCPGPSSPLAFLQGRQELTVAESEAFAPRLQERMNAAERLLALERDILQARADLVKIDGAREALTPWLNLPVPQTFRGTARFSAWVGSVQGEHTASELLGKMEAAVPALGPVHVEIVRPAKEMTSFYVLALRRDAKAVEEALNALGFERPPNPSSQVPAETLARLGRQREELQARMDAAMGEVRQHEPLREELRLLEDYLRMRAEKYAVLQRLGQSRHALVLRGYVASQNAPALRERLEERFDCAVELASAAGEEDAPVKLKNRPYAAALETVLENYNLPSPGEIDPSPVLSFFYYLMFGLMLSDAGYGLIVAAVCGLLPLFYPNMEDNWRRNLRMFFWCGVSTVFWGVLFSSYFGDAVNVISKTFFGREVSIPPLWFLPLDQPMRLLMFSLGIGVAHLTAGYGMKARNLIAQKQYVDILYDVLYPVGFLAGLLAVLMGSPMFRDMAGFRLSLPGPVSQGCLLLSAVCLLGIVLTGGRESKSWGKRILKGLYAAYNVIAGWLSDILSYSRLLALGLATGVIASVFNSLGTMAGGSVFGAVIFIVVFLIGQGLNMGINLLGAYVHSNRLEYVEFLGKFYQGTGRKFTPFGVHTKHYKIKEET